MKNYTRITYFIEDFLLEERRFPEQRIVYFTSIVGKKNPALQAHSRMNSQEISRLYEIWKIIIAFTVVCR
jgi:hypothetical protein